MVAQIWMGVPIVNVRLNTMLFSWLRPRPAAKSPHKVRTNQSILLLDWSVVRTPTIFEPGTFMQLRDWQQEVIDRFPTIVKSHRRFILKAPTGAGKTVLASELIERFYRGKKVIVLCHRLCCWNN